MLEKHGIACDLLHGSDWKKAVGDGKKTLFALPALQEHILEQEDGKTRWNQVITELSRAFALCAASNEATEIRDDVAGANAECRIRNDELKTLRNSHFCIRTFHRLPQPRHQHDGGDRGTHPPRKRNGRRHQARRRDGSNR
jgi:hypothetical protein